ncbi:MAG TPA: alpha/beta fold hydrolase [Phototrophicaceae bacterium]|nr:alpha/beta fold hydrolase [Phototrophicaceae bacterium]
MSKYLLLVVMLVSLFVVGSVSAQDAALTPGQTHSLSLLHNNLERTYRVYVPKTYTTEGDPLPLIIAMHGASGTGEGIESYSGFDDLADMEGFVVAYPDGLYRIWNDGREGDSRVPADLDDIGFISALIDDLTGKLKIDSSRVYATGHSMGGMMAYRLGCELQGKIAAFASVASTFPGYLLDECETTRPIPMLMIQGTDDSVIPWDGAYQGNTPIYLSAVETAAYWALHNGCQSRPEALEGLDVFATDGTIVSQIYYVGCTNDATVMVYAVAGGGHTWPGGVRKIDAGNTSYDLYASAAIWEFFRNHRLSQ